MKVGLVISWVKIRYRVHCEKVTDARKLKHSSGNEEYYLCVEVKFFLKAKSNKKVSSSGIRRCVRLPDWSTCHLVWHFSTSLRLPFLRIASFARAICCRLVKQVSSLRNWKVSFLSSANKSIGGTLARTSTALVDTVLYAVTSLSFPGTTNVGHELSQSGSTLDGFGHADSAILSIISWLNKFVRDIP